MTRTSLALLVASLVTVACGTSSPTELTPLPPTPVDNCTNNPACSATSPTPVAILMISNTPGFPQRLADSTWTLHAVFFADRRGSDQPWTLATAIYVRLSNGDTRLAVSAQFVPVDPAVLEVDGILRYRMTQAGCAKMQIVADGLSTWVWVGTNGACK